jgi:predicted small secreted protein
MRHTRLRRGIAGLALLAALVLAACETTTGGGEEDLIEGGGGGPEDGTEWTFENQSSYNITVHPNDEDHPDQGWTAFSLRPGDTMVVRVDKKYEAKIYILGYTHFSDVSRDELKEENKIVFKDKGT